MKLPDTTLRKMNHREWLSQFASTLEETRIKRGQVVTPFLLGAVTRLKYASEYIELLEADVARLKRQIVKPVAQQVTQQQEDQL